MFHSLPPLTRNLILANIAVYLGEVLTGDTIALYLALSPIGTPARQDGFPGFQSWQIVTYRFLHGNTALEATTSSALDCARRLCGTAPFPHARRLHLSDLDLLRPISVVATARADPHAGGHRVAGRTRRVVCVSHRGPRLRAGNRADRGRRTRGRFGAGSGGAASLSGHLISRQ
jgi:hypothetical protein